MESLEKPFFPLHHYLELLVWEAATWTAGALDSDSWCSLSITHFQEGCEHTPPGPQTQSLKFLFPHNDVANWLLAPLTLLQPSLDAWLITFSAVMILQYQNHCLLGVGGVQSRASFILAELRIFIPRRPLITKTSARSALIGCNLRVAHGEP